MTISGYCYKFDEEFGNTGHKVSNDEIIQSECERSLLIPVLVFPEFISHYNLSNKDLRQAVGTARLKNDGIGIYTEITLFKDGECTSVYRNLDDGFIKNDLNLGLSLSTPQEGRSIFTSEPYNKCRISYVVLGRFMTSHIYKPDSVVR